MQTENGIVGQFSWLSRRLRGQFWLGKGKGSIFPLSLAEQLAHCDLELQSHKEYVESWCCQCTIELATMSISTLRHSRHVDERKRQRSLEQLCRTCQLSFAHKGKKKMERCEAVDGQQMAVRPVPSTNVDVFLNVGCMSGEFRQDITCREAHSIH